MTNICVALTVSTDIAATALALAAAIANAAEVADLLEDDPTLLIARWDAPAIPTARHLERCIREIRVLPPPLLSARLVVAADLTVVWAVKDRDGINITNESVFGHLSRTITTAHPGICIARLRNKSDVHTMGEILGNELTLIPRGVVIGRAGTLGNISEISTTITDTARKNKARA